MIHSENLDTGASKDPFRGFTGSLLSSVDSVPSAKIPSCGTGGRDINTWLKLRAKSTRRQNVAEKYEII